LASLVVDTNSDDVVAPALDFRRCPTDHSAAGIDGQTTDERRNGGESHAVGGQVWVADDHRVGVDLAFVKVERARIQERGGLFTS